MKTLLALIAFTFFCVYLYILFSKVPRLDLGIVIGVTVLLSGWDLFVHDRLRFRKSADRQP